MSENKTWSPVLNRLVKETFVTGLWSGLSHRSLKSEHFCWPGIVQILSWGEAVRPLHMLIVQEVPAPYIETHPGVQILSARERIAS